MMNDIGRPPLRHRHVERGEGKLGAQVRFHGPANYPPAPGVQHDREIQKAGPDRYVRDVRHPQPIGPRGGELPLDEIRRRPGRGIPDCRPELLAAAHAVQARGAHQPSDALAADADPLCRELGVNAWRTVRSPRLPMRDRDLSGELHIDPRPRRQEPLPPRVVAAGGDTQLARYGGHAMEGLVCGHELESLDRIELVSRANQAAALLRSPVPHAACDSPATGGAAPLARLSEQIGLREAAVEGEQAAQGFALLPVEVSPASQQQPALAADESAGFRPLAEELRAAGLIQGLTGMAQDVELVIHDPHVRQMLLQVEPERLPHVEADRADGPAPRRGQGFDEEPVQGLLLALGS
jgi:hypothetical protein